ncbi:hypothetical protein GCM10027591_03790 [Zhihengliuella somnathii]
MPRKKKPADDPTTRAQLVTKSINLADKITDLVSERLTAGDPNASLRDLGIVFGTLVDKHIALDRLTNNNGLNDSISLLDSIAANLEAESKAREAAEAAASDGQVTRTRVSEDESTPENDA